MWSENNHLSLVLTSSLSENTKFYYMDTFCKKSMRSDNDTAEIISLFKERKQNPTKELSSKNILRGNLNVSITDVSGIKKKNTRNFPNSLFSSLPDFIKRVIHYSDSNDEKDIMMLGALVTTSSCLTNVYGYLRDEKLYPNLLLFISAPASAGKGRVRFSKRLIDPIHKSWREQYKKELEDYKKALKNKEKLKKKDLDVLEEPKLKMLFIPGNSTSSAIYQTLEENEGRGIIFETEGDVLTTAFKSEHGDYSSGFRKTFHHETISIRRRFNNEHREIEEPKLSVLLTGTPLQIQSFIPNVENGLFSRFMFYRMKLKEGWAPSYSTSILGGLGSYFDRLGEEFFKFYQELNALGKVEFRMTKKQFSEYDVFFREIQTKYIALNGIDFISVVRRHGIIFYRIAMILTVFRAKETGNLSRIITCSDLDFKNTKEIVTVLLKHSELVYSQTPKPRKLPKIKTIQEQILELLPLEFNRKAFYDCSKELNVPKKSADKLLDRLTKANFIQRRKRNDYVNAIKLENDELVNEN